MTRAESVVKRNGVTTTQLLTALAVLLAAGGAVYFALFFKAGPLREIAPPEDNLALRATDPNLIAYEEIEGIPTGMNEPRGIAVGRQDRVWVAGDRLVRQFDGNGARLSEFATRDAGTSITATLGDSESHPGTEAPRSVSETCLATRNSVEIYDANGLRMLVLPQDPNCMFSSIAVGPSVTLLADDNAAAVVAVRFSGQTRTSVTMLPTFIGRGGDPNDTILLRSPHFDVAYSEKDGLLWITNPGRHKVEAYTLSGEKKVSWGRESAGIDGFSGCCNPKDIAFLPTGEVVTSEKGLPRVKVYSREGKFLCVVAGPESFDPSVHYLDLAVDSKGRVLVLDPARKMVRIFVKKKQP